MQCFIDNSLEHNDRYTPLDYALMGDYQDVCQYLIEQGALSITGIEHIAATKIQVGVDICEVISFSMC